MPYSIEYPDLDEAPPERRIRLGTDELPTDVVRQKVAVWIFAGESPDPEHPRLGGFQMRFTLGDDANPELSPDEARYILRLIEHAAKSWRDQFKVDE